MIFQQQQQQFHYGEMTEGFSTPTHQQHGMAYQQYSSPRMIPAYGQTYPHSVPLSPISMAGSPFGYPNFGPSAMPLSPIAPMPSSPVEDGPIQFQRICMAPSSPSPLRKDSAREETRKTIQKRLRMKMIRKGQLPPNPTVEELQLCGVTPIQTVQMAPVQVPVYYYQNPYESAYPFMQQPHYGMYPPSPSSYGMSPMTYAAYNKPRSVSAQEQHDYNAIQQQQHQFQQALQQAYDDSCPPASPIFQAGHDQSVFGDFQIDGLFTNEMMQQAEQLATTLEPFMLPDRTEQNNDSQFEQYFNTEVSL
jgi:hypothetical protein